MPDSKAARGRLVSDWAKASGGLGLGLEFLLPTLLGLYLDRRWNSKPWATLIGLVLGFVVGMLHIARLAKKSARSDVPRKTTETNPTDRPSSAHDRLGDRDAP